MNLYYYIYEMINEYFEMFNIMRDDLTIMQKILNIFYAIFYGIIAIFSIYGITNILAKGS